MDTGELKGRCFSGAFRPDKRLGQNFLVDKNVRDKILTFLPLAGDLTVLEIGPGFGMMTESLAQASGKVFAVEKDEELYRYIAEKFGDDPKVEPVFSDILDVDIKAMAAGVDGRIFIYGNVPYNITVPIIEKAIENKDSVSALYMVIQDEVAARLCASPGTKVYGAVTCYVNYHARVRRFFKISKNCFFPKPKVESCLVGIDFLDRPSVEVGNPEVMFRIIRKAFSERRKKVLNPLSSSGFMGMCKDKWAAVLKSSGVDGSLRAEDISLELYARISDEAEKAIGGN